MEEVHGARDIGLDCSVAPSRVCRSSFPTIGAGCRRPLPLTVAGLRAALLVRAV